MRWYSQFNSTAGDIYRCFVRVYLHAKEYIQRTQQPPAPPLAALFLSLLRNRNINGIRPYAPREELHKKRNSLPRSLNRRQSTRGDN